jgi:hypothetical protein
MYFPPVIELIPKVTCYANPKQYIPLDGSHIDTSIYPKPMLDALNIPYVTSKSATNFLPGMDTNEVCKIISSPPVPNPLNGGVALPQFALQEIDTSKPVDPREQFLSTPVPGRSVYIGVLLKNVSGEKTLKGIRIIPRIPAGGPKIGPTGELLLGVPVPAIYSLQATHDRYEDLVMQNPDRVNWENLVDPTRFNVDEWAYGAPTEFSFPEEAWPNLKYMGFKLIVHEWEDKDVDPTDTAPGFYRVEFDFVEDACVFESLNIPAPVDSVYAINLKGVDVTRHFAENVDTDRPVMTTPEVNMDLLVGALSQHPNIAELIKSAVHDAMPNVSGRLDEADAHLKVVKEDVHNIELKYIKLASQPKDNLVTVEQFEEIQHALTSKVNDLLNDVTSKVDAALKALPAEAVPREARALISDYPERLRDQLTAEIRKLCADQTNSLVATAEEAQLKLQDTVAKLSSSQKAEFDGITDKIEQLCRSFIASAEKKIEILQNSVDGMEDTVGGINAGNLNGQSFDVQKHPSVKAWYVFSNDTVTPNRFTVDLSNRHEANDVCNVYKYCQNNTALVIKTTAEFPLRLMYRGRMLDAMSEVELTGYGENIQLFMCNGEWVGVLNDGLIA